METAHEKNKEGPPPYPDAQYGQQYPSQPPPPYTGTQGTVLQPPPPAGAPGVVQQQPQVVYVQPVPLANPPPDSMIYAIMVTICCCWPIGIFAILKASECRSAIARGDQQTALQKSAQARKLSHIALFAGICCMVITFVIVGVYIGVILKNLDNRYD